MPQQDTIFNVPLIHLKNTKNIFKIAEVTQG